MFKNKKITNESENKMLDKQLNTMLTSIGNNTIQNEVTSMGIVQRNNELFQSGNFKYNNDSIYSMLGIKSPNAILTETRGFETVDKKNDLLNNLKKISLSISSTPNLQQGIFFNKRLYFSVGGLGKFGTSPFKEISKRFYSRIDPQNPLPALIIRTKNIAIY